MGIKKVLIAAISTITTFIPNHVSRSLYDASRTNGMITGSIIVNNSNVLGAERVVLGFSTRNLTESVDSTLSRRFSDMSTSHEGVSFNEHDMLEAMRCLDEQLCQPLGKKALPGFNQASCTVNGAMAYVCNYQKRMNDAWQFFGGQDHQPCGLDEMKQAWEELKNDDANPNHHGLGWWHEPKWRKTYGWDLGGSDICSNMRERHWYFRMDCTDCRCRFLDKWGSPAKPVVF